MWLQVIGREVDGIRKTRRAPRHGMVHLSPIPLYHCIHPRLVDERHLRWKLVGEQIGDRWDVCMQCRRSKQVNKEQ